MGSLCSTPHHVPAGSRKDPIVFKQESNKVMYEIVNGDISSEKVDVIVNLSNTKLQPNGGVSQSILEKGGEKLQEEVDKIMKETETLEIGQVVATEGGKLHVKHVVHVALPAWRGGNEQEVEQFVQGIKNALLEADKLGAKSVSIPAIGGAGVGIFPKEEVTTGLINACVEYSKESTTKTIESIRFVGNDQALVKYLQETAEKTLAPKTEELNPAEKADPTTHEEITTVSNSQHTTPVKEEHAHEESKDHHEHEKKPEHHHEEKHDHHHDEKKEHHHHEEKHDHHHDEKKEHHHHEEKHGHHHDGEKEHQHEEKHDHHHDEKKEHHHHEEKHEPAAHTEETHKTDDKEHHHDSAKPEEHTHENHPEENTVESH